MELATKTFTRRIRGATLAAILATEASAQSTSWPTPPAPPAQVESPAAQAEGPAPPPTKPTAQFSAARIAQMLAPVALYPDDLLADVLVAATYPLDVAEAAQWLEDPENAALKGDQLFAALQQKSWDPSVKSLVPFPQILRVLDANLEWTEQLGEAYLADPAAVMDAIQGLRRRAQSAGRLVTAPQGTAGAEQEPARIEEPITIEASSSRDRLRPDLRSFVHLRSLALLRLPALRSRLRRRGDWGLQLDQRSDHRAILGTGHIELSHAAYRDRSQAAGPLRSGPEPGEAPQSRAPRRMAP